MLNMSPWGLTATHFVKKLTQKLDFWRKSDRAPKNTKLYTRPPSKKTSKSHQIYYRILLLAFGSNFQLRQSPFSSHKYPKRIHQKRLIWLFPVQHKMKKHRFFVSFLLFLCFLYMVKWNILETWNNCKMDNFGKMVTWKVEKIEKMENMEKQGNGKTL